MDEEKYKIEEIARLRDIARIIAGAVLKLAKKKGFVGELDKNKSK